MDINGSSAIVTGGAGGFGEATVRRRVGLGAKVVIADLAEDKGEALAKDLGDATVFVKTDVTSEESVQAAVDAALGLAPLRLSVAVHGGSAGGGRTLSKDGEPHTLLDFQKTIDAYLTGAFNVTRLAAAAINKSEPQVDGERGLVINTASIAGFEGTIGQVAYSAAKGGVIAFTKSIARENARYGITANAIAPGPIRTPMLEQAVAKGGDKILHAMTDATLLRRLGEPEEIAAAVAFLASEQAGYITGETLNINGGMNMV